MARARHVRVREFIDQNERGMALERGIQIEIGERPTPMRHCPGGDDFKTVEQRLGFRTTMSFHDTEDDVATLAVKFSGSQQHREGLADAGRRTKINAQLTALRLGRLQGDPRQ